MIASKIFPSFYAIELSGDASQVIIPGDFAIDKIALASKNFDNDIAAMHALDIILNYIVASPDINIDKAIITTDYNPEFFPSVKPIKIPTEVLLNQEVIQDEINESIGNRDQINIMITKNFDILGDFVEMRKSIKGVDFNVDGRVAINPDKYAEQKAVDLVVQSYSISSKPPTMTIH